MTHVERFLRALQGELVVPPVTGMTFVSPLLLALAGGAGDAPARVLASTCLRENLDLAFVPSWEPWAHEAASALLVEGVAAAWVVPGVLWPVLESVGVASGLRAAAQGPETLAGELDDALERALTHVPAGVRSGVAAIVVADDLAGSAGPLVDPAFLRAAVFPRLSVVAAAARDAGLPAILHSDGDMRRLMSAAASAGFIAIHGDAGGGRFVEESLSAARSAGLTMIGGIPTAALADIGSAQGAGQRARTFALDGGLLPADDGGVTMTEEAAALFAALRLARAGA